MGDIFEKCMGFLLVLLLATITFGLIALIVCEMTDDKVCKVYSEPKTRTGFVMVDKVAVPTTYTSRDCLVYEQKE
jgi:hypothetical protein